MCVRSEVGKIEREREVKTVRQKRGRGAGWNSHVRPRQPVQGVEAQAGVFDQDGAFDLSGVELLVSVLFLTLLLYLVGTGG